MATIHLHSPIIRFCVGDGIDFRARYGIPHYWIRHASIVGIDYAEQVRVGEELEEGQAPTPEDVITLSMADGRTLVVTVEAGEGPHTFRSLVYGRWIRDDDVRALEAAEERKAHGT